MNGRALLLLSLAAGMLAVAAVDALLESSLITLGVPADQLGRVAPVAAAGLAGAGFLLLVVALVGIARSASRRTLLAPYKEALRSFAAEFGRGVGEDPAGLFFLATRDAQRVEVRIDPRPGGGCIVTSPSPARQALAWLRAGLTPQGPAAAWREVEKTDRWQLRAELPAMSRPLLADPALMEAVGRLFAGDAARAVTHTLAGIRVETDVPAVEAVDAHVRVCVELAFRLRRVNG